MLGWLNSIQNSRIPTRIRSELLRKDTSQELLDTYNGNGLYYIQREIEDGFNSKMLKSHIKHLKLCYPIVSRIVNKLSKVYKEQPKRKFYVNGREIIPAYDEFNQDGFIDPKLYDILTNKFYSIENKVKIKDAEIKTNLLNTTIYKVNKSGNKLTLDYIPNDYCDVSTKKHDNTIADKVSFILNDTARETWTVNQRESSTNGQNVENSAGLLQLDVYGEELGYAFAPFVVFRDSIPDYDFWNFKKADFTSNVKQINMMFTELRYLIRYSSYGLKYGVNVDVPDTIDSDPMGFWLLNSREEGIGGSKGFEVGEIANSGKLQEVRDAIVFMLSQILYMFGLNTQDFIASADKSSAESKMLDRDDFYEFIKSQQDIWRLNEKNLFDIMRLVWNRDNQDVVPYEIEMQLDFAEVNPDEMLDDVKRWVVEIESNVSTPIDWIMAKNKDYTRAQAEKTLENNLSINSAYQSDEINIDEIDIDQIG